ncbi:MAG TPA: hypothetical protein DHV15_09020 [Treponema sp.]|uniref:Uncharacterized protein n=1 Tax=Treponema denticola (strain ATCC 35405 / DSM 14222 / CIP 103919 / JCM 8153 / KCTC 15104) TaxID=243275 RepID=Q73QZ6_TREDE|nr:hypothetical protein TDE_0297 [Treponema denticola ATCC 35405]HCY95635.1 hypothetical protein [Treponema sp.]
MLIFLIQMRYGCIIVLIYSLFLFFPEFHRVHFSCHISHIMLYHFFSIITIFIINGSYYLV